MEDPNTLEEKDIYRRRGRKTLESGCAFHVGLGWENILIYDQLYGLKDRCYAVCPYKDDTCNISFGAFNYLTCRHVVTWGF
jgi:hypothetical protein